MSTGAERGATRQQNQSKGAHIKNPRERGSLFRSACWILYTIEYFS